MSLRAQLLRTIATAPSELSDATPRVVAYLRGQFTPTGGARGRGRPNAPADLYYTAFALQALCGLLGPTAPDGVGQAAALTGGPESLLGYLRSFQDGDGLDLVHLSSLIRCWACIGFPEDDPDLPARLRERVEHFRTADGAFRRERDAGEATVYDCFLAQGAMEDLACPPDPAPILALLESARTADGAYANAPGLAVAGTAATAAAVALLCDVRDSCEAAGATGSRNPSSNGAPTGSAADSAAVAPALASALAPALAPALDSGTVAQRIDAGVRWLRERQDASGGWCAHPLLPAADLLSTGTALFALRWAGADLGACREGALDFLDALWDRRGAFRGHLADDDVDCEYTFYALLALGALHDERAE